MSKEEKKEIINSFILEVLIFGLCLFLNIISSLKLSRLLEEHNISLQPISLTEFIFWFLIVTLLIIWLVYFTKSPKKKFLKAFLILAVFLGSLCFFNLWLNSLIALLLTCLLTFLWTKKKNPLFHNLFLIVVLVGVGSRLGLNLEPETIIVLLALFSFYDYLAVYRTKHMVRIAGEMLKSKTVLGFIIPQKISDFKANLKETKIKGRFLVLGSGDIIFPLIMSSSLLSRGVLEAVIVGIFGLIGLSASFFLLVFQKKRKPIPALPPIALFLIIGYIITKII